MKHNEKKKDEINKNPALANAADDENNSKSVTLGIVGLLAGGFIGGAAGKYFFGYTESSGLAVFGGFIGYFIASGGDAGIIKYFFK